MKLPTVAPAERVDYAKVAQTIVNSRAFWPGIAIATGVALCFWSLLVRLPTLWNDTDGYYSHGFLVPLIAPYIVFRRWDKMKHLPVKAGWAALAFLVPVLLAQRAAAATDIPQIQSGLFIISILLTAWLVAGFRWALALSPAILFLVFMLPIWTALIDSYTGNLQVLSTSVAQSIIRACGMDVWRSAPTILDLDHYTVDIAVPCSGLRLVIAVTAFTVMFNLIGGLKVWANAAMVLMIFPLCLFINGLRIALIGIVGNLQGKEAALKFHDYSGYLTLVLCFIIIFNVAKVLGWKR